jgi:glucose/arabinose dehydrogenase
VSAIRITLLRDADRDGAAETRSVFLQNLNQPFGMALVGQTLFVANTDGVMRFPYTEGQTRIESPGEMILPLPSGGYNNHWTRNILASRDGGKLYSTVGSASNVASTGWTPRSGAPTSWRSISTVQANGSSPRAYAIRMGWDGSRPRGYCGRR